MEEKTWKRIVKGEMLPTSSIIRPIDGGLPNIAGSHVTVGQDCYYLSIDDAYELLKDLPLETEAEAKERNEATIIKKLIGLVKETEFLSEENRTSLLDWLEKQGKQNPNPYSGTSFEYNGHIWGMCARDGGVEILIDGHLKGRVFTNDNNAKEMFIKALERVEEQNSKGYKLTDCDKNTWWEDFKVYTSCTIEQKPAWSEEDERIINRIEACLDILCDYEKDSSPECIEDVKDIIEHLKSLKSRVQPQPKQEWSKEDEDVINHLLAICAGAKRYRQFAGCLQEDITKYQTWLKSLRPQHTWKPSDEQIAALEYIIKNAYNTTFSCKIAKELLEQLKKLREE